MLDTNDAAAVETLRQRAYLLLKRAVIAGQFAPGHQLTIRSLSEQLGIGMMPVREGVQQLASEGALELLPNRTVRVPLLTSRELGEIFEARVLIEGEATSKAASRMTGKEARILKSTLATLISGLSGENPSASLATNMEFHFKIYRASGSATLVSIIERLWLRIGPLLILPYRGSPAQRDSYHAPILSAHHDLVAALAAQDPAASRACMEAIIRGSWVWHSEIAALTGR